MQSIDNTVKEIRSGLRDLHGNLTMAKISVDNGSLDDAADYLNGALEEWSRIIKTMNGEA